MRSDAGFALFFLFRRPNRMSEGNLRLKQSCGVGREFVNDIEQQLILLQVRSNAGE